MISTQALPVSLSRESYRRRASGRANWYWLLESSLRLMSHGGRVRVNLNLNSSRWLQSPPSHGTGLMTP